MALSLFKTHFDSDFTLNPLLHYSPIQEPRNLSTIWFMSRAVGGPYQKRDNLTGQQGTPHPVMGLLHPMWLAPTQPTTPAPLMAPFAATAGC